MLECNIDARGKAARFLGGLAGVVFGLVAAILLATGVVTIPMGWYMVCLLYTSPSPRDVEESRMPSSA